MFPNLKDLPFFVYDVEATGLKYPVDRMFGFSIATPDARTFYYDLRRTPEASEWVQDQTDGYKGKIVAHHAKFDWLLSKCSYIRLPEEQMHCTMTVAALIDADLYEYDLDSLCHIYGLGRKIELPSKKNMADLPFEIVEKYASMDALLTLKLHLWQQEEIINQGIQDIVAFEHKVFPRVCRANAEGIRVDLDLAQQAMVDLTPIIDENQKKLNDLCGWDMNVNSPPQVKKLLKPKQITLPGGKEVWSTEDGTVLENTGSGGASIGAEALRRIKHPAAQLILETRSLLKTRDTFLKKHILEHAVGNRVYPTINQNKGEDGGTGTGRLSYVDPALQQIPSRNKKVAAIVKACFLPDEGQVWVDNDMASFEVRVFAHLANNQQILAAYQENPEIDFHQFVADITGLEREAKHGGQPNAKQLNLSMIFNSGNGAIAEEMGMPWHWDSFIAKDTGRLISYKKAGAEAMAVINHYHNTLPGIKELASKSKSLAETQGYVQTFTGRRLRFPNKRYAYKTSGLLIQATAADINKRTWIHVEEALNKKGRLVLNTHDSYGLSIDEDVAIEMAKKVKDHVERNNVLNVPVILEVSEPGLNWWASTNGERIA